MLGHFGYIGMAFAWGYLKASAVGARASHWSALHEISGVVLEELQFREALQGWVLQQKLGMAPSSSNLLSASLFGLAHWDAGTVGMPDPVKALRALDAGVGGLLYGAVYQRHGLFASVLAHLAHNIGATAAALRQR